MSRRLQVRRHVIDPVRGADDSLRRDVVRKADARAKVVEVGLGLAPVVFVHEHQGAPQIARVEERVRRHEVRDRRGRGLIEVAQAVEALGPRNVELIAQTDVQRQVACQLPIVLDV